MGDTWVSIWSRVMWLHRGKSVGRESWDLFVFRTNMPFCPRSSVAIDGVSLTVNCRGSEFGVTIIPHIDSSDGSGSVNIETDIVGKYIVGLVERTSGKSGGLTQEFLAENGYTR